MFIKLVSWRYQYSTALTDYWARHFACALDVFALLTPAFQHGKITSEGEVMSPGGNDLMLFSFVKKTLRQFMRCRPGESHAPVTCQYSTVSISVTTCLSVHSLMLCDVQFNATCSPLAVMGSTAPNPRAARQLWGLTVRSEQALRATAPLWPMQRTAWGDAAGLLANIAWPASWLSDGCRQGGLVLPTSASVPLARLLLSCAATELKAAHVAGLQPNTWIFYFMDAAVFRDHGVALSASVVSLLLPRMAASALNGSSLFACGALEMAATMFQKIRDGSLTALSVLTSCHVSVLLSRSVAEVSILSQATHSQAYWAVAILTTYADTVMQVSHCIVQRSRTPGLSAEVRVKLAQPVLMLLRSPLLGLLASLQHAVVGSCTIVNLRQFPEGYHIPPVHLLPAHMQPDTVGSELSLQVGHSRTYPSTA